MNPILNIRNLSVQFSSRSESVYALSNVTLSVQKGEILGVVGESGCGKSTLVKALLQLLPKGRSKVEGSAMYEDLDLIHCPEKQLRKIRGKEIGCIFQDPMTALNPTMKIGDQIIEGHQNHYPHVSYQEAKKHAEHLLHIVGIPEPSKRLFQYPHTLSGGMKQKATIAMALACSPKILIADEPTTALDPTVQNQILAFLSQLQQKREMTLMLITHNLSLVAGFCDRVVVMYAGQIVEIAPVEDLFYRPSHPYTQKLLKSIPRIDLPKGHLLHPIEGAPPILNAKVKGCPFQPRCSEAVLECQNSNPPFLTIGPQRKSRCWLHKKEGAL